MQGVQEGLSQMSVQSSDEDRHFVWNFPIQSCWQSSNPHGWPRLVISVYGPDMFGNDVIHGYGSACLPIVAGSSTRSIAIYRLQSSSLLQECASWLTGRRPELIDPASVARNDGRDGTKVTHPSNTKEILLKSIFLSQFCAPRLKDSSTSNSTPSLRTSKHSATKPDNRDK